MEQVAYRKIPEAVLEQTIAYLQHELENLQKINAAVKESERKAKKENQRLKSEIGRLLKDSEALKEIRSENEHLRSISERDQRQIAMMFENQKLLINLATSQPPCINCNNAPRSVIHLPCRHVLYCETCVFLHPPLDCSFCQNKIENFRFTPGKR